MDYQDCPYRKVLTKDEKSGEEIARCEIATKECNGQIQGYGVMVCYDCSRGINPQTIDSPIVAGNVKRSLKRAFLANNEFTSKEIRVAFFDKLMATEPVLEVLEELLTESVIEEVITDNKEAQDLHAKLEAKAASGYGSGIPKEIADSKIKG